LQYLPVSLFYTCLPAVLGYLENKISIHLLLYY
jgi:hypothetical protein